MGLGAATAAAATQDRGGAARRGGLSGGGDSSCSPSLFFTGPYHHRAIQSPGLGTPGTKTQYGVSTLISVFSQLGSVSFFNWVSICSVLPVTK